MPRVLVVDDEKSIRTTFRLFLINEGNEVEIACNIEEAYEIVKEKKIDLIFSDIVMPKGTGVMLLEKVRKIDKDIQFVIMTGEPTFETARESIVSDANEYLIKPVSKDLLLRTANRLLEKKKLIDEKKALELENENYRKNLELMVESKTSELKLAIKGTIETIEKILEHKDPYTAGHVKRVGHLSLQIAKKMNLDEAMQKRIYYAGYLHDIGKLMIASEILSKPGKLSAGEFVVIKEHVSFGYELINDIRLPWDISEIILEHHERLDGSGYPRGLKGDEIILEARILSVADVIEAMTSHRPYRPGFGIDVALNEIKENSSLLYDEKVCKAVLELFYEDGYQLTDAESYYEF